MRSFRRVTAIVLAFILMFTFVPANIVKAALDEYPTKFRVYYEGDGYDYESTAEIQISDHHAYIDNVKSGSKNLIAGLTDYHYHSNRLENDTYTFAFIAKKQGTYNVSYDVMKDGKKIKTIKAKVYAYPNPIDVQLKGINGSYYGNKKTAVVNVKALKGNTIQKIEVGTHKTPESKLGYYRLESDIEYQTVKNNSTIKLGTRGDYYKEISDPNWNDTYYDDRFWVDTMSKTYIRVTYKDKYTKQNKQIVSSFSGLAK